MSVRSFQSSICVVFLSYWKDLTEHVVLFLVSSPFLLFFFVIISLLWETYFIVEYDGCERPAKLCYYSSDVQSFLLFLFVLLQYDGCERPVILKSMMDVMPCRSFSYVGSFLFFFTLYMWASGSNWWEPYPIPLLIHIQSTSNLLLVHFQST